MTPPTTPQTTADPATPTPVAQTANQKYVVALGFLAAAACIMGGLGLIISLHGDHTTSPAPKPPASKEIVVTPSPAPAPSPIPPPAPPPAAPVPPPVPPPTAPIQDAFQKTGQTAQTEKGVVPMWILADNRCILISRCDPRATRVADGWIIEFGNVSQVLNPEQLKSLYAPPPPPVTKKKK